MNSFDRRDFLKTGGAGLMAVTGSMLWHDTVSADPARNSPLSLFEQRFGVPRETMKKILGIALSKGGDFSELFFEYKISNSVRMEEGIIKDSSEEISLGVGIRVLKHDQTGYGYTNDLTFEKMKQTALTAAAIAGSSDHLTAANLNTVTPSLTYYDHNRPLSTEPLKAKVDLISRAYNAAIQYDSRVNKVQSWLTDELRTVTIANSDGLLISDVRPQVRLYTRVTAEDKGNRNTALSNGGGRVGMDFFDQNLSPETIGKKAAEEAITLLSAIDPPAGEQTVVLSKDQSGVMIHEAVGHPLEADGNRKKTSIMWDKLNQQVANSIVTIVDDPTIPCYRGTLAVDDEGVPGRKKMLIENGKLVGYIQDRLSAKIMGVNPDGHGRRQSYQNYPIPRMTNTVLEKGESDPEEIIQSVKNGFYAVSYQGGQVQGTGKFTFSVNMGYLIEDGKLTRPVKNATLIGTNVQILNEVDMVGNDMGFFLGTCGKEGQSAPVTAGTPTLRIKKMTVGGRA